MKKWWFLMGAVGLGLLMCKQSVGTGSVTVRSEPSGADVFFDDSLTDDKTDCVLQDVSLGRHMLRLELEGYDTWQSEIELTEDEPDVEIDVELTEISGSTGVVQVSSVPTGAEIWLNNANTGYRTNYVFEDLVPGDYMVLLRLEGCKDWGDTVELVGGDTVSVTAFLVPDEEPVSDIILRRDYVDSVPAGQSILYLLEVLNFGTDPDVPDITYDDPGRSDWLHRLVAKEMISDLVDTDGDGIPDVGIVSGLIGGVPGVDTFYLEVIPPYTAVSGTSDTTVLRATSSINDTVFDIATIETLTWP